MGSAYSNAAYLMVTNMKDFFHETNKVEVEVKDKGTSRDDKRSVKATTKEKGSAVKFGLSEASSFLFIPFIGLVAYGITRGVKYLHQRSKRKAYLL